MTLLPETMDATSFSYNNYVLPGFTFPFRRLVFFR